MTAKDLFTLNDLPDEAKDPDFWTFLSDKNLPRLANFQILNELRKYDPEALNDPQTRTLLGKLKALQEMIDLPESLKNHKDSPELDSDNPVEDL